MRMKVEVVVDKDNTHFTYMHECDKVKDDSNVIGSVNNKLVLLKEIKPQITFDEKVLEITRTEKYKQYESVAVYSIWTSWIKLPDGAEKCERCARYRILNVNGYCHDCLTHLNFEKKRAR